MNSMWEPSIFKSQKSPKKQQQQKDQSIMDKRALNQDSIHECQSAW